ncbi:ECF sigma factor [Pirellula sp. SH-Sr6A]|uniref:RNA polymerase sigma factor n=1 Tax=Pirellula sp. SH-Sr6A TaxID=1632865 RepID=UPI00078BAE75|nr:ECF-type sigma factor [Pirellula sp. SH-Sr6A]AMV35672.1 ECF sigma factor [Pirellula sp. SH-Sr6A]
MNDELLREAKAGSAAALNDLIASSQWYAFVIVKSFLGSRFQSKLDIDDVVQITLAEVSMTLSSRCKAETYHAYLRWVSCIARSATYREIEKLTTQKRSGDLAAKTFLPGDNSSSFRGVLLPCLTRYSPSAEESAMMAEKLENYLDLASAEGRRTRAVVDMMMNGVRKPQIAESLGVSVQAVYREVSRFRKKVFSSIRVAT